MSDFYGVAGTVPGTTNQVDPTSAFPVAGDVGEFSGTGTGQFGVSPVLGSSGSAANGLLSVWDWLNKPFTTNMSPLAVALLVGIVMVSILWWNIILYHIRIAGEAI